VNAAPAWLKRAWDAARRPPLVQRLPLVIGAQVVGSVEPRVANWLAREVPDIKHGFGTLRISTGAGAGEPDATLAQAARFLQSAGLAGKWRDELLAVTDDKGRRYGAVERAVVRPLGVRTVAVHLMGLDARGHVWLQQRAHDKATDPGKWDTLVGGLVSADEPDLLTALARETWEEAGLNTAKLQVRAAGTLHERRPVDDTGYLVEDLVLYEAVIPETLQPKNQDGEVAQFALLPVARVLEMLQADEFTLEATLLLAESLMQRGVLR
jgi:8-oxo-dGTP pyrophosphatase MutT (NUDIX family)